MSNVCGFEAKINGEVIRGTIKTKDSAFDKYDNSIASNKTALLLEQGKKKYKLY